MTSYKRLFALGLIVAIGPADSAAQTPSVTTVAVRLASLSSVTGYERPLADSLLQLLPGSALDRAGNVVLELGGGAGPRRLVACPMDEPGMIVGEVRDDGWLTIRRAPGRASALFDQSFEGHRVTVVGARGPVPGVVGIRSIHLTAGRPVADDPFTPDQALVDIGAASRGQVEALGVRVLAPVTLEKQPHAWGSGLVAAPVMGRRAACAALVVAARAVQAMKGMTPARANVVVAFTTGQGTLLSGIQAMAALHGDFAEAVLVDGPDALTDVEALRKAPLATRLGTISARTLPVRYGGTPVESVSTDDLTAFTSLLTDVVRGGGR